MKYKNEDEIKKALAIDSWRNLSKDKMIQFAAMMPDMDTEVALKVVEQFPAFKAFALDALAIMEKRHESTLDRNKESQENAHRAYQEIRVILEGELSRGELSWEQRKYILELIMETGAREFAKDSENKLFLDNLFKKVAVATVGVIGLGVVFVGGKVLLQGGGNDEDEGEA